MLPADVDDAVRASRIDRLIEAARCESGFAGRRYLASAIERAIELADPGAVGNEQASAAADLGVPAEVLGAAADEPPPHAVRVPLVAERSGDGFVRLFYVTYSVDAHDPIDRALGPVTRRAVREAIDRAARFSGRTASRSYRLAAARPAALEHVRIDGPSLAAATFVSAVSLWTRRRVRAGTAVTGALRGERVIGVGGIAAKLDGIVRGRPDVTRVIVPDADRAQAEAVLGGVASPPEVIAVGSIDALIAAALEEVPIRAPSAEGLVEGARRSFRRGWEGGRWLAINELLERLSGELPLGRPDLRVEVLALLGASLRNVGSPSASAAVLDRALALIDDPEDGQGVPDIARTLVWQHRALTLRQLCEFGRAARAAREGVRIARRGRLRGELFKALGCAGLVATARGRPADAVRSYEEALALVARWEPSGAPRTCAYLVEAHALAGDLRKAEHFFHDGLERLAREPDGPGKVSKEVWLRARWALALVDRDRFGDAERVLESDAVAHQMAHDPQSGLLARRALGLARAGGRRPELGWELLAASPAAYGTELRDHLRFRAHSNVLFEARSRAKRGAIDGDVASRVALALAQLPDYGRAPEMLAGRADAVRAALFHAKSRPERLERALAALVERCARIE